MEFDPNGVGRKDAGVFGLPYTPDEAQVVLIPAPWAVTVSYGGGTENGPRAISEASPQIDYFHESYGADSWKLSVAMQPLSEWNDAYEQGLQLREKARDHILALENGEADSSESLAAINDACGAFHDRIEKEADALLAKGKLVGVVGGDHSTPLGLMRALAKKHGDYGILQIDAHCDLRESYEGFTYSHASIMDNAVKLPEIKKLVQVGIRDYSIKERERVEASEGRIETFFDDDMKKRLYEGGSWAEIAKDIVAALPDKVYVSFDIDGLDPAFCPHTGTPVPGGLAFQEATHLMRALAGSGKKIIGFDVVEVSPAEDSEWDANVGMRILWNLALWAAKSNGIKPLS